MLVVTDQSTVWGVRSEDGIKRHVVVHGEDFAAEGEDRVPHRLYQRYILPLVLSCEDVVRVVKKSD